MATQKKGSSSTKKGSTSGTQPGGSGASQQFDAETQEAMDMLVASLRTGKARLQYDDKGNVKVDYPKQRRQVIFDPYGHNTLTLAVPKTDKDMHDKVEATLELVNYIKTEKPPSGVVVDISKITPSGKLYREGVEFEMTKKVLGSGNTAADDIVIVKDKVKQEEHALKTMMISSFNKDEIRCWVDMSHTGIVPALYVFYMKENKIYMHMEILKEAKTLNSILDDRDIMGKFEKTKEDQKLRRPFSLFVLDGALDAVTAMHGNNWVHGDIHGDNVMVQKQPGVELEIKIIDFGRATQLRSERDGINFRGFKMDIINVLGLFTRLYTSQASSVFQLDPLDENWKHKVEKLTQFSQEDKAELFCIVDAALKIVAPSNVPTDVSSIVKDRLGNAMGDEDSQRDILKKVCMHLFPEEFEKEQLEQTKHPKDAAAAAAADSTRKYKIVQQKCVGQPMSASVDFSELSDYQKATPPSLDSASRELRPVRSMDDMHTQAFIDLKRLRISIRK